MCPIENWVVPSDIAACRKAGLKMWMYISLQPWHPYVNFRLDNLLYEPRFLFWQSAQLGLTGVLYWSLNHWQITLHNLTSVPVNVSDLITPFLDPTAWSPMQSSSDDVGDGKLLYAAVNGVPLASTRLSAIRDGLEDHEKLLMFADVAGDSSLQTVLATSSGESALAGRSHLRKCHGLTEVESGLGCAVSYHRSALGNLKN